MLGNEIPGMGLEHPFGDLAHRIGGRDDPAQVGQAIILVYLLESFPGPGKGLACPDSPEEEDYPCPSPDGL